MLKQTNWNGAYNWNVYVNPFTIEFNLRIYKQIYNHLIYS